MLYYIIRYLFPTSYTVRRLTLHFLYKSHVQTKLAGADINTKESNQNPHEVWHLVCPWHQDEHNGNPWSDLHSSFLFLYPHLQVQSDIWVSCWLFLLFHLLELSFYFVHYIIYPILIFNNSRILFSLTVYLPDLPLQDIRRTS